MKKNIFNKIKSIFWFVINPRLLFCFAIAWFITNGWSYAMLGLGTYLGVGWMVAVSGAYLAFLWFPFSPEKIVTFGISIILLQWLFPNDDKTLAVLKSLYTKAKGAFRQKKKKRAAKKEEKRDLKNGCVDLQENAKIK